MRPLRHSLLGGFLFALSTTGCGTLAAIDIHFGEPYPPAFVSATYTYDFSDFSEFRYANGCASYSGEGITEATVARDRGGPSSATTSSRSVRSDQKPKRMSSGSVG